MGRFKSGDKGRRAERDVAERCQNWWQRMEPSCIFRRTPLSGGWAGPEERAAFKASGDLMTTARRWPFTVEVKHREAWSVNNLIDGKPTAVWKWWRQAIDQAVEEGGEPKLWFRRNRKRDQTSFPWLVLIPFRFYQSRQIIKPDITWDIEQLAVNGVDYGDVLPVLYFAESLTRIMPEKVMV